MKEENFFSYLLIYLLILIKLPSICLSQYSPRNLTSYILNTLLNEELRNIECK